MGIDMKIAVKNMVRNGTVSSVDPETGTVRVVFEDEDRNVSAPLPILTRGSAQNKDYWLPDVGEQVVCIFAPNDKNTSTGWVLGTYFSDTAPPQVQDADIHRFTFSDGSYIEHNRSSHEMTIKCVGHLQITGARVDMNY